MACRTGSRSHSWLGRHGLDDRGLVGGVLHHAHAEQEVLLRHDELRGLGQQLAEHVHAVGVQLGGADDLAHADGHHLDDAALDRRAEVGVRLDAADEGNAVGGGGKLVHVDGHAVDLAQLHHLHLRLDRAADIALGDAVVLQHLALALGVAPPWLPMAGKMKGLPPSALISATTCFTHSAMLAIPRLPTPSAMVMPGLTVLRTSGRLNCSATAWLTLSIRVVLNFCRMWTMRGSGMSSPPAMFTSMRSPIMFSSVAGGLNALERPLVYPLRPSPAAARSAQKACLIQGDERGGETRVATHGRELRVASSPAHNFHEPTKRAGSCAQDQPETTAEYSST